MRREARVFTSIWKDPDFLALPPTAQRLYLFLLSQEDLTHCGVIPLRPTRWARKAQGLPIEQVETDLELLAAGPRPFVVIDLDTGELLVRSLIRHDEVWKLPNVMKAAREAATLIESLLIRSVLLNELLRVPAQESSSALVRKVHADFVNDLRNPSGNPSPNPSRKDKPNGSADPGANGSSLPSQGKGEGYGPVLQVSPFPGSPSPSQRAPAGQTAPLWPSAVPDASPEEGKEAQASRKDQDIAELVAEVRAIRSDWSTDSIRRAVTDRAVAERPWPLVRAAALTVAKDPESKHAGRLKHDGPWWPAARQERVTPTRPPWCGDCDERTRMVGDDRPARCPVCHPLREAS